MELTEIDAIMNNIDQMFPVEKIIENEIYCPLDEAIASRVVTVTISM